MSLKNYTKNIKNHFEKSLRIIIFKQNHMTDLSIMISFTSFQAYYANVGPAAVEKTSGVDVLFFTYLSNIFYSSRNQLLN